MKDGKELGISLLHQGTRHVKQTAVQYDLFDKRMKKWLYHYQNALLEACNYQLFDCYLLCLFIGALGRVD